ncbi:MAG: class I SAM-dependent methyltransferase [Deltaproteobacteria bacterium]|nr:class I SAM-dependent methyltransferase [Deltaproteobacteria bacterium]
MTPTKKKPEDDLDLSVASSKTEGPTGERLNEWAPHLTPDQIKACKVYLSELLRFNKRLNLISSATVPKADAVHILDAVRAWKLIEPLIPSGSVVYDFGTGNGLPGLLSAALSPDRQFRLVDRDQRKMEFCKHLGATLKLTNVSYLCMDLKDVPDSSVQFAISRGFASVSSSMLFARRQFAVGGRFFMLKGEGWSRELAEVQPQLFSFWRAEMIGQYSLPDSVAEYVVIAAEKISV